MDYLQQHLEQRAYMAATRSVSCCIHGEDCPVCKAIRESEGEANIVRKKEYEQRCKKYMDEWRKRRAK